MEKWCSRSEWEILKRGRIKNGEWGGKKKRPREMENRDEKREGNFSVGPHYSVKDESEPQTPAVSVVLLRKLCHRQCEYEEMEISAEVWGTPGSWREREREEAWSIRKREMLTGLICCCELVKVTVQQQQWSAKRKNIHTHTHTQRRSITHTHTHRRSISHTHTQLESPQVIGYTSHTSINIFQFFLPPILLPSALLSWPIVYR